MTCPCSLPLRSSVRSRGLFLLRSLKRDDPVDASRALRPAVEHSVDRHGAGRQAREKPRGQIASARPAMRATMRHVSSYVERNPNQPVLLG